MYKTKTWRQLQEEFGSDKENLEREFNVAIYPYKFVKRDWWGDYNYTHWLIYAPEEDSLDYSTPQKPHLPVVVIGGHSRAAEAREIALRLSQARAMGWDEGFVQGLDYARRKAEEATTAEQSA